MKKIVSTEKAPAAIGPYSQAVIAGGILFGSGQIPIDPESGETVPGGIEEQTRQVLKNIGRVLESAGLGMNNIVRTECSLSDLNNFAAFNKVYAEFFPVDPPARSTVQAARLPKEVLIEIAYTAVLS